MVYRNVILITVDALRSDYFTRENMSNTFRALKDAVVFKNAFSQGPSTPPSFTAIMTSVYPLVFGYPRLSPYLKSLAEILRDHGFVTYGVSQNPYHSRIFGYDRGFTTYYDFRRLRSIKSLVQMYGSSLWSMLFEKIAKKILYGLNTPYFSASIITNIAIRLIKKWRKDKSKRFFLWLHYMDLHNPLMPPIKYFNKIKIADVRVVNSLGYDNAKPQYMDIAKKLYAHLLRYVDENIRRIIKVLKSESLFDETAMIITSDHGEEFFEHGNYGHWPKLYDELVHVPLLIHAPAILDKYARHVVDNLVGLIDLAPTVLDLLGIPVHKQFMGKSLMNTLNAGKDLGYIISECGHRDPSHKILREYYRWAIRTRRWKLIYWPSNSSVELYDLTRDPDESLNVARLNPDVVNDLLRILSKHIKYEKRYGIRIKLSYVRKSLKYK